MERPTLLENSVFRTYTENEKNVVILKLRMCRKEDCLIICHFTENSSYLGDILQELISENQWQSLHFLRSFFCNNNRIKPFKTK